MLLKNGVCLLLMLSALLSISVSQASVLIENATILSMSGGEEKPFVGYIFFENETIKAIGPGETPDEISADFIIDGTGKIVMPGFVSGHNHLWQSGFRGIAPDKELHGWLSDLHWTYGSYFEDGDFYNFTLHGALDQLSKGITTTYNHSHRLGSTEAQYMESLAAELDAGQHFIFAYNANMRQEPGKIRQDIENFIQDSQHHIGNSPMLAASIHSVGGYFGKDRLQLEMELAKKHQLTSQIHYLEEYQRRFVDRKKWSFFLEAGAVDDGVSYAHFIHTTDKILSDTAKRGAAMIWNPLSNGRLASGLADIPRYLELGIGVGMGVDGAASGDISDPFENMRMGLYSLRMQHKNAQVMSPMEVLHLHTLSTAKVLKIDHLVGSLEIDKKADILIIDPGKPGTGAIFDVAATLVFATNASNIEAIYVAGQLLVEDGNVINHDELAIQREVVKRVERMKQAVAINNG